MSMNTNPVLGVVVLMRHGDRQGFYQDPTTYTASKTTITALGEVEAYDTGAFIKSRYLNATSPNNVPSLANLTTSGLYNQNAITVVGDNGGEGGVIVDSTIAALQGMFPPSVSSNSTLSNNTVVVSPLGGYQYVPVTTVNPNTNVSLEPWTSCQAFTTHTTNVYNSTQFQAVVNDNSAFLQSLAPIAGNRSLSGDQLYNLYDFINVQSIHNATFAAQIDAQQLSQIRGLANYHEDAVFTDPDMGGIGNLAGRTLFPQILSTLHSFTNSSVPSRMTYMGLAYKPFISIANMTGAGQIGIVNYAASTTFEVRQSMSGGGYDVRMNFKNSTDDADYRVMNMFGSSDADYPLDQFIGNLSPALLPTLEDWCTTCGNTQDRGCDVATAAQLGMGGSATTTYGEHDVSPLAAGFIGAGVTLAVVAAALALGMLLGLGKKRRNRAHAAHDGSDTGSSSHSLRHGEKRI